CGWVQAGSDAMPTSLPHIQRGTMRALGGTGAVRSHVLPDLPTIGETVPGYDVSGWTGVGVPSGTPADIIATLNREINAGLTDPRLKARLAEIGGGPHKPRPTQPAQTAVPETPREATGGKVA